MTLRWLEGFDLYGGTGTVPSALSRKWATVTTAQSNIPNATGRLFGYALKMGTSLTYSPDQIITQTLTSASTMIVGLGLKKISANYTPRFVNFRQGSSIRCSVRLSGTTALFLSSSGTTLYTWTGLTNDTSWHHYEVKVVVNSTTTSTATLTVDGVSKGSSGVVTTGGSTTAIDNIMFDCTPATNDSTNAAYGGDVIYVDDIYICDSAGSTNNDFLGTLAVEAIVPTGTGSAASWTPSAGANWSCVDEKPSNDDTDYVSTNSLNARDSYACGDLASLVSNFKGVMIQTNAKNIGGGSPTMLLSSYNNSTYQDGSALSVTSTSYAYYGQIFETSDGGSTAWTAASINAAEFGAKYTG